MKPQLESGTLGQLDVFVGSELVASPGRIERTFSSLDDVVALVRERLASGSA